MCVLILSIYVLKLILNFSLKVLHKKIKAHSVNYIWCVRVSPKNLYWVPGHRVIGVNEETVSVAKIGASLDTYATAEEFIYKNSNNLRSGKMNKNAGFVGKKLCDLSMIPIKPHKPLVYAQWQNIPL